MRRSIRKFNIPPRATPQAFELLKIGLFKFPPLGGKKAVQMPHQLVLNYLSSQTNFVFNHGLSKRDTAVMTPSNCIKDPFQRGIH